MDFRINIRTDFSKCIHYYLRNDSINDCTVFFMAYIFIVKYSVLFGLFNFGLGLGLLNLASTSASSVWPRPWPQAFGLV